MTHTQYLSTDVKRSALPNVGDPATIHLYTDTLPAVVVKVNKKSIVVRRVEHDENDPTVRNPGEPFPAIMWPGILDRPIGEPERYSIVETDSGYRYRNGSISVTIGKSVKFTDYRY